MKKWSVRLLKVASALLAITFSGPVLWLLLLLGLVKGTAAVVRKFRRSQP